MALTAVDTEPPPPPPLPRARRRRLRRADAGHGRPAKPTPEPMSAQAACAEFARIQSGALVGEAERGILVAALSAATPDDCVAAAFARPPASRRGRGETTAPFCDAQYYEGIAAWLGCTFDDGSGLKALIRRAEPGSVRVSPNGTVVSFCTGDARTVVMAPEPQWLPRLAIILCENPGTRNELVISTPAAIAEAADVAGPAVVPGRVEPLHAARPDEVADRVFSRWQLVALVAGAALMGVGAAVLPLVALVSLAATVSLVLGSYAATRGAAVIAPLMPELPSRPLRASELPVYSVLIPLYREDEGVCELVKALRRLDYPAAKLDIIFLVEADDPVTKTALLREGQHLSCRIVVCPDGAPRTKPRALNAGLRQARGSLVTIFDAEDRPDPRQLRLAAETFAAGDDRLAALQARLTIDHCNETWLTRMFAIEYACQFDRLLPMIAGRGGLVLLGGTSNHFRTDVLMEVGGWDPFNVTEDADLAVRLRRRGYTLGVLMSDTFEEAPLTTVAWLKQRSRWFKGFVQTLLVHNRNPRALVRELGLRDAALMYLFIVGALTAALAHNAFIVLLGLSAAGVVPLFGGQMAALVGVQLSLAAASYGANFLLGVVSIKARKATEISPWTVLWFPVYWMLMGIAVAIALYDLVRRPHHWRKTTHGLARRPRRLDRVKRGSPAGRSLV